MKIVIQRPDTSTMWWEIEVPPPCFLGRRVYEPEIHGQAKAVIMSGQVVRPFACETKIEKNEKVFGIWTEVGEVSNLLDSAIIPFKINIEKTYMKLVGRFSSKIIVTDHAKFFKKIKDSEKTYIAFYQRLQHELNNALRSHYEALPYRYLAAKNTEFFTLPFDRDLLEELFRRGERNIRIASNKILSLSDYGLEIQSINFSFDLPPTDLNQISQASCGVLSAEFEEQLRGVINRIKTKDLETREKEIELFIKQSKYLNNKNEEDK